MPDVTLKDVADAVGVNVSTVSRALSADRSSLVRPATRARIEATAKKLGYRPNLQASALRRGRSGTVGVIVADISNPYIGPTLRGITSALATKGQLPFMAETGDESSRLAEVCTKLLAQRVDAIITAASQFGDEALLRRVADEVPLVLAVRSLPDSGLNTIAHDDERGGRLAAEHLLELGHRRLGQLQGPASICSFKDRARGFRQTVEAAGATCIDINSDDRLPNVAAGSQLAKNLLATTAGDVPTAIFAHNDTIAVGALAELRAAGLSCPRDVSMIGYNDVPLTAYLDPPLTTIRIGGYELGRIAAEMISGIVDGEDTRTGLITLSPDLVVRSSTGPPPQR